MINMKRTLTPREWFEENVNIDKLRQAVINAIEEVVYYENEEDGKYIALVHDIVSGNNGHYIPYYALEYFGYEVDHENDDFGYYDSLIWELDEFAGELANILNEELNLNAAVSFEYWDFDGSYSLVAYIDKDVYEEEGITGVTE